MEVVYFLRKCEVRCGFREKTWILREVLETRAVGFRGLVQRHPAILGGLVVLATGAGTAVVLALLFVALAVPRAGGPFRTPVPQKTERRRAKLRGVENLSGASPPQNILGRSKVFVKAIYSASKHI